MSTFQQCPTTVKAMADSVLREFDTHQPLVDAGVTVDFLFAFPEVDPQTEEYIGDALKLHGVKCLGICRKVSLSDRVKGCADAEIKLDGVWWGDASDEDRRALIDHELHHLAIKIDKRGLVRDDIGRPVLQMRKHDFEVGWFKVIAGRHGAHSQERQQAACAMAEFGQYFWPDITAPASRMEAVELSKVKR